MEHESNDIVMVDGQIVDPPLVTSPKSELSFLLLGTIGLSLITELLALFFQSWFPDLPLTSALTFLNTGRYLLVIAIFILLFHAFKMLKPLFKSFLKVRALVTGLAYGALVILVSILYSEITGLIFQLESDNENQKLVVEIIKSYPILSFIWIPFIGPFVEEITYRLGLFAFLRRYNKYLAYVLVGLIFGLIHFNLPLEEGVINQAKLAVELVNLPNYMISGLLFAYIYEKEGIASSTYAHISNNLLSYILTIIQLYAS